MATATPYRRRSPAGRGVRPVEPEQASQVDSAKGQPYTRLRIRREARHSSWRDGRVAEGAGLLNQYTGNRIVGSNPTLSANLPGEVPQPSGSLPGAGPAMRAAQWWRPADARLPPVGKGRTASRQALHYWNSGTVIQTADRASDAARPQREQPVRRAGRDPSRIRPEPPANARPSPVRPPSASVRKGRSVTGGAVSTAHPRVVRQPTVHGSVLR